MLTDFQAAVAEATAGCNDTVMARVVEHFAEIEANRRVPLIIAGLAEEAKLNAGMSKFKPDNMLNEAGEVTGTYWTQGTITGKKKAEENLKKWQDALNAALTDGNYQALEKLVKSGGQSNEPKVEAE